MNFYQLLPNHDVGGRLFSKNVPEVVYSCHHILAEFFQIERLMS
jgi:hypothetical protein